ncbi:MAG: hypothetical protein ROO76_05475 [Terriglobia bacterium]|nr:hypothetical protein [Terriglobia bacterium]
MMRTLKLAVLVLVPAVLAAQSTPESQQERAALEKGQNVLVSTFDKSLPRVSLKFFLESESDGAKIAWEVNDCGEQTGNPADRGSEIPICVEANFDTEDGRTVDVMVAVGSLKKGIVGPPALFNSTITDEKGVAHSVKLIELPAKIHRNGKWLPRRHPRDLPRQGVGTYGGVLSLRSRYLA